MKPLSDADYDWIAARPDRTIMIRPLEPHERTAKRVNAGDMVPCRLLYRFASDRVFSSNVLLEIVPPDNDDAIRPLLLMVARGLGLTRCDA